jgi:hypothetical protein
LPFWDALRARIGARAAMRGVDRLGQDRKGCRSGPRLLPAAQRLAHDCVMGDRRGRSRRRRVEPHRLTASGAATAV